MNFRDKIFTFWALFSFLLFFYLARPLKPFPLPPTESLQSDEPADTETPFRRAYFTNFKRDEVILHYKNTLNYMPLLNFNYPPEEAQFIIRDQTRSYYLEELTEPLRQSIFINGFIPQEDKDIIMIKDNEFFQKITIKQVNSSFLARMITGVFITIAGYLIIYITDDLRIRMFNLFKK